MSGPVPAGPVPAGPVPDRPRAAWPDVADWTPWRVSAGPEGPVVEWCHTTGLHFDDPFFDQTVERAFRHPFRLLFQHRTALADIGAAADAAPSLPVAGIVLHLSRCGSTLVAQMLDALPSLLVLSEPGPVDAVLRPSAVVPDADPGERARWVRGVVAALARPRTPEQTACVLKLDAWAVMDLPLLRRALPGVPWVFCYRDGIDVLASHRGQPGFHVIPGTLPPSVLGWDPATDPVVDGDDHAARVLARLGRAALDHLGPDGRLVAYRDLPDAVAEVIAPHFGIEVDVGARAAMAAAGRRDAKNPVLPFAGPRPLPDDPGLRAAAARWLDPVVVDLDRVVGVP